MAETSNGGSYQKYFKDEIQFIAWCIAVVLAIIVPLITYRTKIDQNFRSIAAIEKVNAQQDEDIEMNTDEISSTYQQIRLGIIILNLQLNNISRELGVAPIDLQLDYGLFKD